MESVCTRAGNAVWGKFPILPGILGCILHCSGGSPNLRSTEDCSGTEKAGKSYFRLLLSNFRVPSCISSLGGISVENSTYVKNALV